MDILMSKLHRETKAEPHKDVSDLIDDIRVSIQVQADYVNNIFKL